MMPDVIDVEFPWHGADEPDTCPTCKVRVLWVGTARGTRLMLDVAPSGRGHIAVVDGVAVLAVSTRAPPPPHAARHFHHMKTCRTIVNYRTGQR
jgi:hypothetical protein